MSRSELEKSLEDDDKEETKENIQFYTDNISGLNLELSALKSKWSESLCPCIDAKL